MSSTSPKIMWKPSKELLLSSQIAQFINFISEEGVDDFHSLYNWSINQPELFWLKVWDFCGVIAKERGSVVLKSDGTMLNSQWFPEAELNFAENLLTPLASAKKLDEKVIIFWGEDKVKREVSLDELLSTVRKIWWLFKQEGLSKGDRVAAYIPNIPETVFFMLGVAANGGVWSSCSPDFGTEAVLDRFSQITPSFLITTDGYYFKGKVINIFDKVKEVIRRLPSLKKVIVIPYTGSVQEKDYPEKCISLNSWLDLAPSSESISISYTMVPFNSPLYIMYSSGTTGKPKCIVHGVGGTLLEHLKEHKLHTDISEKDVFFYQTSCGWMMWNWLVTGLASKAQLVLYDGYPLLNNNRILFELAESAGITVFGTNARYLSLIEKMGLKPAKEFSLTSLRAVLSTGSVLAPESFEYVYKEIKEDLMLSSISGGTDIIGCFALGCPILPVYKGELQCRSLGLKVEVFNDKGEPVIDEQGELVCTAPFPSMPIYFWNDPEKSRYKSSYFSTYEGVWRHGDWVKLTSRGTMVFYGRSDAVLNPSSGVRVGTAEIYNQLEKFREILEAVAVEAPIGDERWIMLLVRLKEGQKLTKELEERIRKEIKESLSPFYVPKVIKAVADLPRTKSGKTVELLVKRVLEGKTPENLEALANPESVKYIENLRKELEMLKFQ